MGPSCIKVEYIYSPAYPSFLTYISKSNYSYSSAKNNNFQPFVRIKPSFSTCQSITPILLLWRQTPMSLTLSQWRIMSVKISVRIPLHLHLEMP